MSDESFNDVEVVTAIEGLRRKIHVLDSFIAETDGRISRLMDLNEKFVFFLDIKGMLKENYSLKEFEAKCNFFTTTYSEVEGVDNFIEIIDQLCTHMHN